MSRYVDKPHGLTIGSDNVFFVIDQHHEENVESFRDGYRAIVSFRGYRFESTSTANVFIQTPAEQLIWRRRVREEPRTVGGITYQHQETYYVLSSWAIRWLEQNVGPVREKWDCYTQAQRSGRNIFFKRRKDARAFCNMIADVLRGVKIGEW